MQRRNAAVERFPGLNPLRPRSMLFTLYGDYAYPRGADMRLSTLALLARRLGISETALRSAVARLARDGWLVSRRVQGRSLYGLSRRGVELIEEGTARIYQPRREPWDGTWCVLTYAIPESRRAHRDRLRKQLAWLGFGPLGGGTYVSPRRVETRAAQLVEEHGVAQYSRIFSARFTGPIAPADMVRRCWDLPAIARQYGRFIRHYGPLLRADERTRRNGSLEDGAAFVRRFALTHDFRHFPFVDPDLPASLLPRDWAGAQARQLFERYHALLTDGALRYFNAIGARSNNVVARALRTRTVGARSLSAHNVGARSLSALKP
jgi:phenylacetic acid degradation operon negative regulatory protein